MADPTAICDVPQPQVQYITFPSFAQSQGEICGIWSIEDDAAAAYDKLHGYPDSDPRAVDTGLAQEAGYAQTYLEALAYAHSTGADLTPDQQGAYAWFEAIAQQFQITIAKDALNEYRRWASQGCRYLPPNTKVFDYRPKNQVACQKNASLEELYGGLTPPSESDFIAYGTYEADQSFDINGALGAPPNQLLIDQGISLGAGAMAAVIAGGAPQALVQLQSLQGGFKSFLRFISPKNRIYQNSLKVVERAGAADAQKVDALQQVAQQEADGVARDEINPATLEEADLAAEDLTVDADVAEGVSEVASAGADEMTGPLVVAAIAITIAVTEGEAVFTAAHIPSQLQSNLNQAEHPSNISSYAWDGLTGDSAGAVTTLTNVQGQMQFPQTTIGTQPSLSCPSCLIYDTPPATASAAPAQLRITALNSDGTPSGWSRTGSVASYIDTWPMGAANGGSGVPEVNVALDSGEVWTSLMPNTGPTDESEAGLSGYLPSGELHYFNAAGQPMIAYLHGDQFETLSNPGSNDAGGADAGDACATAGECTLSDSIVVMANGGTPQLQDHLVPGTFLGMTCTANDGSSRDCLTDTLQPDGRLVPADGSTSAITGGTIRQQGTSQLYRLTIEPDKGTPAASWVANRYNTTANDLGGGAPNGGLIAGQTVTFTDPDISPSGYSTSYRWQIQALCAYDPAHSPQTIQGVPVCSSSPDYGSSTGLSAAEQDLTSCPDTVTGTTCNPNAVFGWTEDPAFHGGPVTTLTGQSVNWTWPAPGTYHVRLITTDQYGVSVTSDQDLVVSASSAPSSSFSWSSETGTQPSSIAPSVIGPIVDGDAVTLTGCVNSPDTVGQASYTTPSVKVDWGDGSSPDIGTAGSSSDPNLVFSFHPVNGCSTPWEYQATHSYASSTSGQPFIQVPVTVTVGDMTVPVTPANLVPPGTSTSSSTKVYVDVYPSNAKPSFVSGSATTYDFTSGEAQTVSGYVASGTDATITYAAASGVTLGSAGCSAGLPTGMGFTPFGDNHFTIEGTPNVNAGGCYALDVTATNPTGSTTQQVIIDVAQAPAFTSSTSVGWTTGSTGSFTIHTSGFPAPALSVASVNCTTGCGSALPADISFVDNGDGTATLSSGGAAIAAGDTGVYAITLSASGPGGTATQTLTVTIGGAPVFTSPTSAGFTTRQDGTFNINVSGSPAASISCSIVISGTPTSCMSSSTGYSQIDSGYASGYELYFVDEGNGTAEISGAGNVSGEFTVTLTATNSVGSTQQTLSLYVSNTGGAQLTMIPGQNLVSYTAPSGPAPAIGLARFIVGQAGTVTLCSDDTGDTLTSRAALPAGLTITNNAGTACGAGYETITVSGTPTLPPTPNSTGSSSNRIVSSADGLAWLTIELIGPPAFSSSSSAVFTDGAAGSFTVLLGTGSYSNYSYNYGCLSESGQLPAGLSFTDNQNDTATISGTPTVTGTTTVTLTGTDCGSNSTSQQLTIAVRKAPTITSADSAGFQVGAGGAFTVTTNADAYPVPTLSAATLPAGVSFTDNGDGTGTLTVAADAPKTSAATPITLTASSVAGTDTQQLNLTVGVAPQFTAPVTDPTPVVMAEGAHASYTFTASGVPTPALTCTIGGATCSGANLPAGLTFTDNGDGTATVSGTPTALGGAVLTVTAADGVGSPTSTTLDLAVDAAPGFAGSVTSGSCASASAATGEDSFVADSRGSWTLCGSGTPAPSVTLKSVSCAGSSANLPAGLSFADNGDGSATLTGTPAIGSGAACPGGYDLQVAFANAAATVVKHVTLKVQEVIVATTPSTSTPLVPGAPNSIALGAAGRPAPAFTVDPSTPLPSWLTLTSGGNGTATLTGVPPLEAAGSSLTFAVEVANSDAKTLVESLTVPIARIGLRKATPPPVRIGRPYSYRFKATAHTTFALANGSVLPLGLRLTPAGQLEGTAKELGRFPVSLTLTGIGQSVSTGMVMIVVGTGGHPLEITQFRTIGPRGQGDWFVQILNTTRVSIPLTGWDIGVEQSGSRRPGLIPIGTGSLKPGATIIVAGTAFSMRSKLPVRRFGGAVVPLHSGFQIVAPNGAVVDAAGVRGALHSLVAGRGLRYPRRLRRGKQYAFVRDGFQAGLVIDSGNNARNFTFGDVVLHHRREHSSTHRRTHKRHPKGKKRPTGKKHPPQKKRR